ncbi:histidine phosphatase family protein [Lentzea fradiae]|uniref:histidine phosphatase family protein n=1 Tax=Lentzea fradiae TaxID=200378 RepID=UPI000B7E2350|nr:histidine phosphatase family protein [Lentzea fradiae]
MSTRIVLVRHAQSVWPKHGEPDDDERPLTARGLADAELLVPRLVAYRPTAVLSSPQRRAVQTVTPAALALGLEVIAWPELREWESGLLPSADWEELYRRSWEHPESAHGEGESLDGLTRRAGRALARVATVHPDETVLVGSHGTFASRALIAAGHRADWDFCRTMPMPAIYEVTSSPAGAA